MEELKMQRCGGRKAWSRSGSLILEMFLNLPNYHHLLSKGNTFLRGVHVE